ncbi:MAG: nucleotidyltransferase family protein [Burkholderiales bacterium]|nr:nucleotidyltransferase family protein [Burkholderiales bacterium]
MNPQRTPADLLALLQADAAFDRLLRAARALGLRHWCLAAGAVRNRAWDAWYGAGAEGFSDLDVDLVHFDPALPCEADARLQAQLQQSCPGPHWDVVNQAHVHRWFRCSEGRSIPANRSLTEALGTWPETATAVGVRLERDDRLSWVAPLGLTDLLMSQLRANPRCPDPHAFTHRLRDKRWLDRWPRLGFPPPR